MLQPTVNTFEPGKQVEYDKNFEGDQLKYGYERQERELQDKLFALYEEIDEENDPDE